MLRIILILIIGLSSSVSGEINVFDVLNNESDEQEAEDIEYNNKEIIQDLENKNQDAQYSFDKASFRILDRIMSKTMIVEISTNKSFTFDDIEIKVKSCFRNVNNDQALVSINRREKKQLFSSWIFSKDQFISVFEHPIYNVTLVGCV